MALLCVLIEGALGGVPSWSLLSQTDAVGLNRDRQAPGLPTSFGIVRVIDETRLTPLRSSLYAMAKTHIMLYFPLADSKHMLNWLCVLRRREKINNAWHVFSAAFMFCVSSGASLHRAAPAPTTTSSLITLHTAHFWFKKKKPNNLKSYLYFPLKTLNTKLAGITGFRHRGLPNVRPPAVPRLDRPFAKLTRPRGGLCSSAAGWSHWLYL